MAKRRKTNAKEARAYVKALALPDPFETSVLEARELPPTPPEFNSPTDQTVTVGSQLVGFAEGVAPDIRPHIANAFLLAQLAANKRLTDRGGTSRDWYNTYIKVLSNIGWAIEGDANTTREVSGSLLEVHKEIIPIVTAALGPAAAAATTILAVLNGLATMDKDKPWITLFSRESQRASANQFQISYATVGDHGPRIALVGFELDATSSVTQVLFFKFGASEATFKHFESGISVDEAIFGDIKDSLGAKVATFASDFIAQVDI